MRKSEAEKNSKNKLKRQVRNNRSLRYAMLVPMALMMASVISCCLSYSNARQNIAEDLNEAILALANENSKLWTRQDTIAALRQMHVATHKPLIYQASDVNFKNPVLKDVAYITLALVDRNIAVPKIQGNKIVSDSILLLPEKRVDGLAIQVQGFADCSFTSVFVASDQTLPGVFFSLTLLTGAGVFIWRRKEYEVPESEPAQNNTAELLLGDIKLTPMQRKFVNMLIVAPEMRVDKVTLCKVLWDNKINAEESLYTLVRRTKTALAASNIEIICNRGDSYELCVNG